MSGERNLPVRLVIDQVLFQSPEDQSTRKFNQCVQGQVFLFDSAFRHRQSTCVSSYTIGHLGPNQ